MTQSYLRSYSLTCCEKVGGNGAKQANAKQRGRRRKEREAADLVVHPPEVQMRTRQARTFAASRLPTIFKKAAGRGEGVNFIL